MNKLVSVKSIINEMKSSDFVLSCKMPMEYSYGLPILQIKNDRLCMVIPFLKYQLTGEVDKTLVYPIRYTFTVELPEKKPVAFEDLTCNYAFEKVNFSMPVGLFRHDAIKNLTKKEYNALRGELFSMYDKVVNALLYDTEYAEADENRMSELLKMLLEPSLFPIYKALDADFYNKYLK